MTQAITIESKTVHIVGMFAYANFRYLDLSHRDVSLSQDQLDDQMLRNNTGSNGVAHCLHLGLSKMMSDARITQKRMTQMRLTTFLPEKVVDFL